MLGSGKDQRINFFVNFLSDESDNLLKKLNIISNNKEISFNSTGKINIIKNEIKFDRLTVNSNKLTAEQQKKVENLFNTQVINDNILGFMDFFNIKKFAKSVNEELD